MQRQWRKRVLPDWSSAWRGLLMNRGLHFRLALSFTIVSLVPLLALGIFSYYQSARTIQEIVSRYTMDITREININIFLNFKNIDDISKVLLNNTSVKEILAKTEPAASQDYESDNPRVAAILKSIKFSNDYITSLYILSARSNHTFAAGDVTGVYGIRYLTDDYQAHYKTSDLYRETLTEYNNYKWWPPRPVLGQNVFILTRKLYDADLNVLGVLVVHIQKNILNNISQRLNHSKNTGLYLFDQQSRLIFQPDHSYNGLDTVRPEIARGIDRNENGSFIVRQGATPLFVVYNTFFVTGWKLVALTPYRQLIAEASMIRNVTLLIILICLLLVVVLSFFIAKGILNPVHKLSGLMKQGATGDMSVRFKVRYQDEIGELGESFNRMMAHIQKLLQMLELEQKKKAEAEIEALEAHINPHFLYNTLASMYWMAMAAGNHPIGRMAAALSNFFRLGLNKGKEFTTVEKEVDHVRNYLDIQKLRFQEQFDYEVAVAEGIGSLPTIKLLLQPLVENSLIHGIEKAKRRGLIRIRVFLREERIIFQVTDNGVGIPEAELSSEGLERLINGGYGLKNVRERLRLYFNNDFTLKCVSIPDSETTFEIGIPVIQGAEGEGNV
jgi:two-component system sensor histidine kinase YesM